MESFWLRSDVLNPRKFEVVKGGRLVTNTCTLHLDFSKGSLSGNVEAYAESNLSPMQNKVYMY
jgi:hypothetical protein